MKRRPSQQDKILDYMRKHGSITLRDAMIKLNINHPAKRISELKQKGHIIRTEWEKSKETGVRYYRYYLYE